MSGLTICAKCKHFVCHGSVWYDQFCKALPPVERTNYQTGEVETEPQYARDQNYDGKCKLYERSFRSFCTP